MWQKMYKISFYFLLRCRPHDLGLLSHVRLLVPSSLLANRSYFRICWGRLLFCSFSLSIDTTLISVLPLCRLRYRYSNAVFAQYSLSDLEVCAKKLVSETSFQLRRSYTHQFFSWRRKYLKLI